MSARDHPHTPLPWTVLNGELIGANGKRVVMANTGIGLSQGVAGEEAKANGALFLYAMAALSAPSPAATVAEGVARTITCRVYKHDTVRHAAYLNARFPTGGAPYSLSFEFEGHRWRYHFTSFDDHGDYDELFRFAPAPSGPADARVRLMGIADDFHPDRLQDAQLALDEMRAAIQALVDDIAVWDVHLAKTTLLGRLNTIAGEPK